MLRKSFIGILVAAVVGSTGALHLSTLSSLVKKESSSSLPLPGRRADSDERGAISRRSALLLAPGLAALSLAWSPSAALAAEPNNLPLTRAPSGLQWGDSKVGTGQATAKVGAPVSIDYSMASTAGRFPLIYTTKDKGAPYRWTMGDGSTIAGIEKAILGDEAEGIPPMLSGGVRRVVIPASLAYQSLAKGNPKCTERGVVGPVPPDEDGAYLRWAQFYCNPRIPYQPDLVVDIKLYGRR